MAAGGDSAQAMESWSTAYNACHKLCEDKKLDECVRVAKRHLRDESMPLYHRMLFELILAGSIGDWYEANDAIRRCNAIWHNTHAYHQNDPDEYVQESLAEIRQLLDDARRDHDMKPRAMEDPRLEGWRYQQGAEEEENAQDEEIEGMGEGEWCEEDVWSSEEEPMEPGESEDVGETMEVDIDVKPEVERTPSEMVEAEMMEVEKEVSADAKRSMSPGIAKVEDVKPVKEPSLKAKQSEVAMMDEQTQPVESAGSGLDGSAKKKPSLASRLLKRTKSTMGSKGKDKDNLKEVKKRGSAIEVFSSLFSRK
jgi:hypothetical protein